MNLTDLRKGLAKTLKATGVRDALPYTPESIGTLPIMFIGSPTINYGQTFDDATNVTLPVWLIVGPADMIRAQENIDPYLNNEGDKSIHAAVNADPTLDGAVDAAVVTVGNPAGLVQFGEINYTGVRVDVELLV